MNGTDLIEHTVRRKLPGAAIDVTHDPDLGGYVLRIGSYRFHGLPRADREALVYSAFERLPLDLIAKIKSIDTSVDTAAMA